MFETKLYRNASFIVFFLAITLNVTAQFGFGIGNRTIQNPFVYSDKPSEEISQYEYQITQKLKKYIEKDKFLVIVRIDERLLPVDNQEVNLDTGITVDRLPGLPNYSLGTQITIPVPKKPKKAYSHNVSIVLDTSLNRGTITFVRRLIEGSGLIDESIGDNLNVEFMDFPNPENFWEIQKGSTGNQQMDEMLTTPNEQFFNRFEELLDKKFQSRNPSEGNRQLEGMPEPTKTESVESKSIDWTFWLVLMMIILLVALMVFQMIQSRKNSREIVEGVGKQNADQMSKLQGSIEKLGMTLSSQNTSNRNENSSLPTEIQDNSEPTTLEVKKEVNRIFLEEIDSVVEHIEDIVDKDDNDSLRDVSLAIGLLNPGLVSYLKPLLTESAFNAIDNGVVSSRYASISEKNDSLANYRESFVRFRADQVKNRKSSSKGRDIFQFLEQLNNNQIYQLVKDESEDMSAILLAQLKPNQTVEILKFFDIPKQTILLQRMSNINNIPTSMYKDVATRFSKKAVAIKDMGNVAVDGLQSILQILETLPIQQQDSYIEDIAKYDLDLARKIKEHFLTIDGLLELDAAKFNRSLEGFSNSDLARALNGEKEELIKRVLEGKTEREKQILESEMQINQNISEEEKAQAQQKLMDWIKDRLKR